MWNNFISQLIVFLIVLAIVPFSNDVFYFFFCIIILLFIFGTSLFCIKIKNKDKIKITKCITKKDRYGAFLINLFSLALYGVMLRFLMIYINEESIANYPLYSVLFFVLNQNIVVRSPGFILMNLHYNNEKLSDKIKILIRNICHFSLIYVLLAGKCFNVDDRIVRLFGEMIVACFLLNILMKYIVFKNESLLDKLLKNKIEKWCKPNLETQEIIKEIMP
jgi:hypothetical protein